MPSNPIRDIVEELRVNLARMKATLDEENAVTRIEICAHCLEWQPCTEGKCDECKKNAPDGELLVA